MYMQEKLDVHVGKTGSIPVNGNGRASQPAYADAGRLLRGTPAADPCQATGVQVRRRRQSSKRRTANLKPKSKVASWAMPVKKPRSKMWVLMP